MKNRAIHKLNKSLEIRKILQNVKNNIEKNNNEQQSYRTVMNINHEIKTVIVIQIGID